MKPKFLPGFLLALAFPLGAQERAAAPQVIHLGTALDHLTAIEFGEPVELVAAGSDAFDIQRQGDKVLIKPLSAGVATDLLVWTRTRRLIYELEPAGEVNHMNFAVDSRIEPKTAPESRAPQEPATDSLMTRAFLAALPVASSTVHDRKDGITVRVEHMLFSKSSVYLHCSIRNLGRGSYALVTPKLERLLVARPAVSLIGRRRSQITASEMRKMRGLRSFPLSAISVQVSREQVAPGETAEVVIAVQPLDSITLLSLTFAPYGTHSVQAFVVL
jgi:hypothetical protein